MNAAAQNDFPLDLLGILGFGESIEWLATARTLLLVFGEIVNRFLHGEVVATLSPVALGPWLLASFASWLAVRLGRICSIGIKGPSQIVWAGVGLGALLGLSSEDLFLKPGDSRLGCFEFSSELGDLGLLTANDRLEPLSPLLPVCFPFRSPRMLSSPVMGLLAEFDLQALDFGILNEHAGMVRAPPVRVQPATTKSSQRHPGRTRVH